METQNLWPDFAVETTRNPKAILKEQAGYLMRKTDNVLSADVSTTSYKDKLVHSFHIIAPALNNYRYQLLTIEHKIVDYYPVTIRMYVENVYRIEANDEGEFVEHLAEQFNRTSVIKIISFLLANSLA